ncbi:hypothetical protein CONCODRAFT_87702 [Conidiobolus coronatus NRRL 28638]|uniref:Uncharacterized protein n=1 Tax=Conidiobolus coronatus (strain ATCC 28846 / CBS 209.66 / NRRL 28638) TaxID=796925 RepID=A0A137NT01_CONC2|nr:hypothetical protein CONCODRAFT_87702 [Conidiobolus coronatus NRRL 28638]|eukprot:KXN65839.1 hypothetical protein CONCODRAFT_87702 [Conidiobolus coronatus NRRL 28638]
MKDITVQKEFIKSQVKILTEPYKSDDFDTLNAPIKPPNNKWISVLNNSVQYKQKLVYNEHAKHQIFQQLSWFQSKEYLAGIWAPNARWFKYPNLKAQTADKEVINYLDGLPSSMPCINAELTERYQTLHSIIRVKAKKLQSAKYQVKEFKKLITELEEVVKNKELLNRNLAVNNSPIFEELEQSRQLITHMKTKDLLSSTTLSKGDAKDDKEVVSKESGTLLKPSLKNLILKNL